MNDRLPAPGPIVNDWTGSSYPQTSGLLYSEAADNASLRYRPDISDGS
jgi:hypothetical protein